MTQTDRPATTYNIDGPTLRQADDVGTCVDTLLHVSRSKTLIHVLRVLSLFFSSITTRSKPEMQTGCTLDCCQVAQATTTHRLQFLDKVRRVSFRLTQMQTLFTEWQVSGVCRSVV